jgi:hypothetical protein
MVRPALPIRVIICFTSNSDIARSRCNVRFGPEADISPHRLHVCVRLDRAATESWHENIVFSWGDPTGSDRPLPILQVEGKPWLGPSSGEISMSRWSQ